MLSSIKLICSGLFLLCCSLSVGAQLENVGQFNIWTTRTFQRNRESGDLSYLRLVRAARQDAFDRVVFEFEGPIPSNYSIEYLNSRFYESEGGKELIRIAGSAFVHVNLQIIPTDEKQLAFSQAKSFLPKGRLKMPSLLQIADKGLFEGYYDFLLGISSRKPFRVTELSKPSRLVIDFRH